MKKASWIFGILLVCTLAGCGGDNTSSTTVLDQTPYVVSTSPADFAGGVLLGADISATFSEPMNDATITITVSDGTNTVNGTTAYGGKTALFTPSADLSPNTDYTVTIAAGAKDAGGEAMRNAYSWQFTTGASSVDPATAPFVVSTSPADFAGGVLLGADISATFSEPMNDATISISVSDGANTVTGTTVYGGRTALFTPSTELLPNTSYTVTVLSAAKDLDGNAMRADYSWQFTTGDPPPWTGIKQFGTAGSDAGLSIAVNGTGEVYVAGQTDGSLYGTNAGYYDVFLAKYDASGNQAWIRQFGSIGGDFGLSVAVNGTGEVYVAGYTGGSLYGTNAGGADVFLAKYDASGNQTWIRQFGTTSSDYGYSVAVSGTGKVYVAGLTSGSLVGSNAGGYDVFLAKYDASGNQIWRQQRGSTTMDHGYSVVVSGSGDAFVAGFTDGSFYGMNAGGYDMFMMKYDSNGNHIWSRQFGTSTYDYTHPGSLAVGPGDALFVAGYTAGSLGGSTAGSYDVFIAKYDSGGNLQ